MRDRILEYCVLNTQKLDKLTTPEIVKHLKREFPEVATKDPHAVISALGEWCEKYRPGVAAG